MPFNLRITFTGILGFVPDAPFASSPIRVYVLVPDGEVDPAIGRPGADGDSLIRHRAFIKVPAENIVGTNGVPSTMEGLWYLGRREFTLETTGDPASLAIGNLSGLASLPAVAPNFSQVDGNALGSTPPARLGSRFVIDAGTLSSGESQGRWVFPDILSGAPVRVENLSNEVILDLGGIETLAVAARPLEGGDATRLHLTAPDGGTVELMFANLCDDNPLGWLPAQADAKADIDFRWHFELLPEEVYADLRNELDGTPLPYPYPRGKGNGRGADCFPAAYAPPPPQP